MSCLSLRCRGYNVSVLFENRPHDLREKQRLHIKYEPVFRDETQKSRLYYEWRVWNAGGVLPVRALTPDGQVHREGTVSWALFDERLCNYRWCFYGCWTY